MKNLEWRKENIDLRSLVHNCNDLRQDALLSLPVHVGPVQVYVWRAQVSNKFFSPFSKIFEEQPKVFLFFFIYLFVFFGGGGRSMFYPPEHFPSMYHYHCRALSITMEFTRNVFIGTRNYVSWSRNLINFFFVSHCLRFVNKNCEYIHVIKWTVADAMWNKCLQKCCRWPQYSLQLCVESAVMVLGGGGKGVKKGHFLLFFVDGCHNVRVCTYPLIFKSC